MRIDAADKLFSRHIRDIAGNRCEFCGVSGDFKQLDCSHFYSRAKESVRFDPDNADSFCRACHFKLETEKGVTVGQIDGHTVELPKAYRKWKMAKLGPQRFTALWVRSMNHQKKDRKMSLLQIKVLIQEHKNSLPQIIGSRPMHAAYIQAGAGMMQWRPLI